MTKNEIHIYRILNITNGFSYVGQTKDLNKRKSQHCSELRRNLHPNYPLQTDWILFGESSFIFETLEIAYTDYDIRERYWVQKCNSINPYGYNLTSGGVLNFEISSYSIKKHRLAKIGKVSGINNPMFGKTHSLETREKISKSQTGKKLSEAHKHKLSQLKGEKSYWYGKTLSDNTKKLISKARTGIKLSEEFKQNRRELTRGHKNPRARKVINVVTGEIYECAKYVIIELGFKKSTFISRLNGRLKNTTNFKYLDKVNHG